MKFYFSAACTKDWTFLSVSAKIKLENWVFLGMKWNSYLAVKALNKASKTTQRRAQTNCSKILEVKVSDFCRHFPSTPAGGRMLPR